MSDYLEIYRFDNVYSPFYAQSPIPNLRFLRLAKKIITQYNLNIIHVHNFNSFIPWYLQKITGLPLIYHQHDYSRICPTIDNQLVMKNNFCLGEYGIRTCMKCLYIRGHNTFGAFAHTLNNRLGQRCLKSANALICLSKDAADLHSKILESPSYMTHIYNIADPALLEVAQKLQNSSPPTKIILFVGRLVPGKGIETLLDAADGLIKRDHTVIFKIIGNGPLRQQISNEVDKRNIKENFQLLGIKTDLELWKQYANARAVVVPSTWPEPFGRVILEAYSFKKPVIASQVGGIPELVRDGETGILFAPGDPEQLQDALYYILDNQKAAVSMGRQGYEMLKQFLPSKIIPRLLELYKKILENPA